MKTSELTRQLTDFGCYLLKHGGKHDTWYSPITGKKFRVWRHPHSEIPTGTVERIKKDAGLK